MAVVAEWVWVDGLWWQNGFVVWVDLGCEFGVKELEDFVTNVGELRLDLGQKAPPKWVAIWVASPKWRV